LYFCIGFDAFTWFIASINAQFFMNTSYPISREDFFTIKYLWRFRLPLLGVDIEPTTSSVDVWSLDHFATLWLRTLARFRSNITFLSKISIFVKMTFSIDYFARTRRFYVLKFRHLLCLQWYMIYPTWIHLNPFRSWNIIKNVGIFIPKFRNFVISFEIFTAYVL